MKEYASSLLLHWVFCLFLDLFTADNKCGDPFLVCPLSICRKWAMNMQLSVVLGQRVPRECYSNLWEKSFHFDSRFSFLLLFMIWYTQVLYCAPLLICDFSHPLHPDHLPRPPGCVHRWRPNGSQTLTWIINEPFAHGVWGEMTQGFCERRVQGLQALKNSKADRQSGRLRCVWLWDFVDNLQRQPFLRFLLRSLRSGNILR